MVHLSAARRSRGWFPPPGALFAKGGVRGHRRVFTHPQRTLDTVYTFISGAWSLATESIPVSSLPAPDGTSIAAGMDTRCPGECCQHQHQLPLACLHSARHYFYSARLASRMLRVGGGLANLVHTGPTGRGRKPFPGRYVGLLDAKWRFPHDPWWCHFERAWEPMGVASSSW